MRVPRNGRIHNLRDDDLFSLDGQLVTGHQLKGLSRNDNQMGNPAIITASNVLGVLFGLLSLIALLLPRPGEQQK